MAKPRRTWRINPRAAFGLGLFALVAVVLVGAALMAQSSRGRPTLLIQARKLAADPDRKKDDLALSYLKEYLITRPRDVEALDLRGELLARSARSVPQLQEAIKLGEAVLRLETDQASTLARGTRRRLVNAYLDVGPQLPAAERKYGTAKAIAKELVDQTTSPADLRLYARALERTATPADSSPLAEAAAEYEKARAREPGDVEGDEHLARIYTALKEPAKADAVLDSLLKAKPKEATAYLAAARHYSTVAIDALSSGRSAEALPARAKVENLVARAVEIAPRDLNVRIQAANLALAAKKPAEAARHLDAITNKDDQQNYQYLTLRGVIALYDNKATDAIESWSRGLAVTGGTEAELSWRLAFVLLQLGRVEDADQLIKQYRRLIGNPTGATGSEVPPTARFLEALKFLKMNEPVKALIELEAARLKVPPGLKPQFHLTVGAACEAVRNESKALEEYRSAIEADPKFSPPRLARARILAAARRPEDAAAEIRAGLAENPEDVSLITSQARLELERQRALPKEKRSWDALQALLDRGSAVAPSSAALAVVRANALVAKGQIEAAVDLLGRATAIAKTDPDLWVAYASQLLAMGRPDRAIMVLDQAADPKAAGDQAALRILRARIQTVRGRGVEARAELVRDLDRVRADQRPELWRALGDLYTAQGDAASARNARRAYAEWARLLPDDPLPRLFVLELALSEPDAPDAADTLKESRDALKKIGGYYALVGDATLALRDHPPGDKEDEKAKATRLGQAERLIDKIALEAPQLRFGPILRGALMQQRNDLAGAAKAYEDAMRTEGGKVVLPRLVAIYNQMGEAGRKDLEILAAANPTAAQGINRAEAEAAVRSGNKDRAEKLARKVVLGDPESLEVRVWEARVLNTLGKPAEAEKTLRDLVDKDPKALGPWMALLYFQISAKDQKAALKTAEQIVAQVKDLERPELTWGQAWRIAGDKDRADQAFDAAGARWPNDPRVGRAAAEYYSATNRPEKAEAVLRAALKRDETQRWAARGLALILSARNADPKSWQAAWDLVREPAPGGDLPEDRLIRAIVLSRGPEVSNRDDAIDALAKLVDDLPADLPAAATARSTLVQSLIRSAPARAAEYAAIDARNPNAPPNALALHTTALIAAKQLEEAERQIDRLAVLAPGDAITVTLRTRLLRAQGKGAEAAAALEQAAAEKLDGPDGEAVGRTIVQALISELNDDAAAARVAEKLIAKYPKTTAGVKAAVLDRQGKREEALKIYLGVIEGGDKAAILEAARNSLALITRDKFDPAAIANAEKVIDAARAKDPKNADLMAMAGYLRHFQGRYDDEMKIYQDALTGNPEDFSLMNNMAWTLSEGMGKPEEALAQVNEAIRKAIIVPPELYDTRGCIYTRMGKFDDAIRDLELAARDRPNKGTILAHLARAYKKAGKEAEFAKARDEAKKAGLTPAMLEKTDRPELEPMIFSEK